MHDMVIRGGTIVDGKGGAPFVGDVAVRDGRIVEVGPEVGGDAAQVIDATGRVVTPGFVDIHTHYDGQVTWDDQLYPSSAHGVTTLVMGNCGVGFAPVHPGREEWLMQLMEGVEDIPGTALSEGITWGWESFPDYLDVLGDRHFAVDVGTQVPHGAVRGYVMGECGAHNEPATSEESEQMRAIVREAVEAGALGVTTSRVLGHRAMDGRQVPGTFAAQDELYALGHALRDAGTGVFELAPAGADGQDVVKAPIEMAWMRELSAAIGRPVTFGMNQVEDDPDQWRMLLAASLEACAQGAQCYPQVAARPFGLLIGLQTHHAFAKRPTFQSLSHLPLDELVARLREPSVRATILGEENLPTDPSVVWDEVPANLIHLVHRLYPMGPDLDYEPRPERSVLKLAAARGVDPLELFYDLMVEEEGRAMMLLPIFNYAWESHDAIREMLLHPQSVSGLSDGGAHCGMICDASIPTYMLTHWARDRQRGERLPLEFVVKKQTLDTATLYGLSDRGQLSPGLRADINVIDFEGLRLCGPRMAHDLPAGGRRLLQEAEGYDYTVVAGQVTRDHGRDTGARPGRLLRGAR
jgi:N-acyl-D-aspartate/D-glutamate deacylase